MPIQVDIADRLYDYTDEEKAVDAVTDFQISLNLGDEAVIAVWYDQEDPRRRQLEKMIIEAVDANGLVRRSQEHVPGGITLSLE